ncbi:methyltransferase [Kitasatospora sp. NPDC051170]|uniref:methyltransferase n=1 Tax=Kitasatospora sp. NPDC051170 TaxID=3364056 RepID=UPI0037B70D17
MTTTIEDTARLRATADFVREHDTATLLPLLLPGLEGPELRALADHCRFAHAALLVFPPDDETLRAQLAACALDPEARLQPSVVVRGRLARRHRLDEATLEVAIAHPAVPGPRPGGTEDEEAPRTVEVFVLTVPPGSDLAHLAAHEREHQHEAHLAFEVRRPDALLLRGLCALLTRHGAAPDGGGYTPHEDATVLYFTAPAGSTAGYRRIELHAHGAHHAVLADHLREEDDAHPAETLLRRLTGAWTTQALATGARMGLPDALDTRAATPLDTLAPALGAHPRALATLLGYLAMAGVVTQHPDGYRLTETGTLLRADADGSMRPLALMYGGPFYRSFGALEHSVRTGEPAFDHLFGEHHFEHFARDPELADLFDRSMAASSRMFDPLPAHPAVTGARTVVDVAGGNGELLERLLTADPGLHGVLLERPHAVEAARRRLDAKGLGPRCSYVTGDFADVPADADLYLLSRVLHDWEDERCVEILRHLARAMPAHADLLVVERLLPEDGSPSLATAWDLHMLCNTGGRERRADHYARLLAEAGLRLLGHTPLPLEAAVLHVRRADTADGAERTSGAEPG